MSIFVGWIVSAALDWLTNFFEAHIAAYEKDRANQAASQAQAAQDNAKAQTINQASKSDEIDSAGDDSSKHL